jgi:hypothetical protein
MLVDTGEYHGLLFDRLVEEHREILAMLDDAVAIDEDDVIGRRSAFRRLARVIRIHARAEETIVFPALDGSYELGHHVREDQAHHRAIDARIRELERSSVIGESWRARIRDLRTMLECHFADEEQVVFPHARCVISDPRSRELLDEYDQERELLRRQQA